MFWRVQFAISHQIRWWNYQITLKIPFRKSNSDLLNLEILSHSIWTLSALHQSYLIFLSFLTTNIAQVVEILIFFRRLFNFEHAGTESPQFNKSNIMVSDALAPGPWRHVISTHDIDYIKWIASVNPWEIISTICVASARMNAKSCRYIFMVLGKNLA